MFDASLRKRLYFAVVALRGAALGKYYEGYLRELRGGIPPDTTQRLLTRLLEHCSQHVPYYAEIMGDLGGSFYDDPVAYLQHLPILTKETIRSRFEDLKSDDLIRRRWFTQTSGGSTGEPVCVIQDHDYAARAGAITLLFSRLVGRDMGEPIIRLWGSERDIIRGSECWQAIMANKLTNSTLLNAYRMSPERMREFITMLKTRRPKLVVAYAQSAYELAHFAEREGLPVVPQQAIITSAETLYPFMRETIERVFQCRVYNRYGCRELGDVACERPDCRGLWVAPWGNLIEIVDPRGRPVPPGVEGEILITSLTNMAMPLVRYRIGDRGVLADPQESEGAMRGQVLAEISGRVGDMVETSDGGLVAIGYLVTLLYGKDWLWQYQIVQKSRSHIVFRIVPSRSAYEQAELDEVVANTKRVMGEDCTVDIDFVDQLESRGSGKIPFFISEIRVGEPAHRPSVSLGQRR
jgi:phenylacetate-CoA ligase